MNIVSFETAKKLKAAGFPQPEPEFGQVWYSDIFKTKWLVGLERLPNGLVVGKTVKIKIEEVGIWEQESGAYGVFAPTAIDIYPKLNFDFRLAPMPKGWQVNRASNGELISRHENPAEAAAEAWLEVKKAMK